MAASKIKKGDKVVILSGKDKGKSGEVTKSMPKDGKVIVSGVNIITRHRKASQANPQGGLERTEAPMHVSKVAVEDPKTGKATRVRFETRAGKQARAAAPGGSVGCVEGRGRGPEDGQGASRPLRDPRRQEGPRRSAVRGVDQWLKP